MAELADALDSKSSVVTPRAGSSPAFGTILQKETLQFKLECYFFAVYKLAIGCAKENEENGSIIE